MTKLESLNKNLESEVNRRTDEIRGHAEFTELLNKPIDSDAGKKEDHPQLDKLLDAALESLQATSGVRGASVLLDDEEAAEWQLQVAAARGAEPRAFGVMPGYEQCSAGKPVVDGARAILPIVFRGEPL